MARSAAVQTYLAVPFAKNTVVKVHGGRWDAEEHFWWLPTGGLVCQ
jgi:hypothetical protein